MPRFFLQVVPKKQFYRDRKLSKSHACHSKFFWSHVTTEWYLNLVSWKKKMSKHVWTDSMGRSGRGFFRVILSHYIEMVHASVRLANKLRTARLQRRPLLLLHWARCTLWCGFLSTGDKAEVNPKNTPRAEEQQYELFLWGWNKDWDAGMAQPVFHQMPLCQGTQARPFYRGYMFQQDSSTSCQRWGIQSEHRTSEQALGSQHLKLLKMHVMGFLYKGPKSTHYIEEIFETPTTCKTKSAYATPKKCNMLFPYYQDKRGGF